MAGSWVVETANFGAKAACFGVRIQHTNLAQDFISRSVEGSRRKSAVSRRHDDFNRIRANDEHWIDRVEAAVWIEHCAGSETQKAVMDIWSITDVFAKAAGKLMLHTTNKEVEAFPAIQEIEAAEDLWQC